MQESTASAPASSECNSGWFSVAYNSSCSSSVSSLKWLVDLVTMMSYMCKSVRT